MVLADANMGCTQWTGSWFHGWAGRLSWRVQDPRPSVLDEAEAPKESPSVEANTTSLPEVVLPAVCNHSVTEKVLEAKKTSFPEVNSPALRYTEAADMTAEATITSLPEALPPAVCNEAVNLEVEANATSFVEVMPPALCDESITAEAAAMSPEAKVSFSEVIPLAPCHGSIEAATIDIAVDANIPSSSDVLSPTLCDNLVAADASKTIVKAKTMSSPKDISPAFCNDSMAAESVEKAVEAKTTSSPEIIPPALCNESIKAEAAETAVEATTTSSAKASPSEIFRLDSIPAEKAELALRTISEGRVGATLTNVAARKNVITSSAESSKIAGKVASLIPDSQPSVFKVGETSKSRPTGSIAAVPRPGNFSDVQLDPQPCPMQIASSLRFHEQFFGPAECQLIEEWIDDTARCGRAGLFNGPHTLDATGSRTKYFFGHGYTYGVGHGREEILPEGAVDPIPMWMWQLLVAPLEARGIVRPGWINSVVMNDYRKGSSIVAHVDPPHLFARPIITTTLFGQAWLSFGASFDPKRTTPPVYKQFLPRGAVLELAGYSADRVTHGILPEDLLSKRRVGIVLRHVMSPQEIPRPIEPWALLHMVQGAWLDALQLEYMYVVCGLIVQVCAPYAESTYHVIQPVAEGLRLNGTLLDTDRASETCLHWQYATHCSDESTVKSYQASTWIRVQS